MSRYILPFSELIVCWSPLVVLFLGAFDDDEIIHVEGDVDPTRDLDIIHEELMFKDMEYINKNLGNLERVVARGGDKTKKPEYVSRWIFSQNLPYVSLKSWFIDLQILTKLIECMYSQHTFYTFGNSSFFFVFTVIFQVYRDLLFLRLIHFDLFCRTVSVKSEIY